MMSPTTRRAIFIWLITGCLLVAAMVVIGGITRLTGSGLSITKWDIVTGTLPPMSDAAWQQEFQHYRESPQYQQINSHFGVEDFKSIYWWEYLHRLVGRAIGMVFLLPFLYFVIRKKIDKPFAIKLFVIFILGGLQGFLGWAMVASGLVDKPYVSHYRLAAHLITAFITYAYTFWLALDVLFDAKTTSSSSKKPFGSLPLWLLGVTTLQIIYGAFVAGKKAGIGYNTWPKMGDKWVADGMNIIEPAYKNLLDNPIVLQFIHRTIALILVALVGWLWLSHRKKSMGGSQRFALKFIVFAILLQFTLGVLTLVYVVPIELAVLHQLGALFLYTAVVFLNHRNRG
ncbi:MAG: COX15/CtaA family protein [Bacteroidetes bacterium]|nr:COX15/CtaA family protein [Bacteroidota bacterium]